MVHFHLVFYLSVSQASVFNHLYCYNKLPQWGKESEPAPHGPRGCTDTCNLLSSEGPIPHKLCSPGVLTEQEAVVILLSPLQLFKKY